MNEKASTLIRQPAAAGTFYPANKEELSQTIENFLNSVDLPTINSKPRLLIVPHAGYEFSGSVAAYGFKAIENQEFKKAIIIGPSHHHYFSGFAISPADFWQTPLGKIEIDKELGQKLIQEEETFFFSEEVHGPEHCLEVEVPFLQKINPQIKILPIIIGSSAPQSQILAKSLLKYLDSSTIIIISSDFSHYPPYDLAKEKDEELIQAILEKDKKNFDQLVKDIDESSNLVTRACGQEAIKVGLILADFLNIENVKLLKYANSGDISGQKDQVVGYASIVFLENEEELSQEAKKELLSISRSAIEQYLERGNISKFEKFKIKNPALLKPGGAFVTLKKDGFLRGCIGRLTSDTPLGETVAQMAIEAAFGDPRFPPLTKEELPNIEIEISVLSPLKKINDPFSEIEIGKHGVVVRKGSHSGVFLPQVAKENNWDLETFMNELCLNKAGLEKEAWKTGTVEIYTFEAQVFKEGELSSVTNR